MNQNLKHTIYRFVTLRSPELIEEEAKQENFITYPQGQISPFVDAVQELAPESSTATMKQAVATAVNEYTVSFASNKLLRTSYPQLYRFSKWLVKNRKKLAVAQVKEQIADIGVQRPTVTQIRQIWDDLQHNILTQGSAYVRDMLLAILVGDFFLEKYDKVAETDEAFQKLAQARVVLDKAFIVNDASKKTVAQLKDNTEEKFNQLLEKADIEATIEELRRYEKELKIAAQTYERTQEKARLAYDKTYESEVQQAYSAATKTDRVVTDEVTGKTATVTAYENLNLPTYTFESAMPLEENTLSKNISEDTLAYVKTLQEERLIENFEEVYNVIAEEVKELHETLTQNVKTTAQEVNVLGTTLPVRERSAAPFSFKCCTRRSRASFMHTINIALEVPNNSYEVASTVYHLKLSANPSSNTTGVFRQTRSGNTITLELFTSSVRIDSDIESFKGEIKFTNGETYTFDAVGLTLKACALGKLVIKGGGTTTSNDDESVTFGLQRLGIADYRRVEQEVCCYVPGEVSHIENIMAREYKERSTRRLRRSDTTDTISSEREVESLTETASTDRFEMSREISSLTAQDQSFGAGVGAAYTNGITSVNTSASYANNTSKEDSNSQAVDHAQEMTERALERIVEKVREERVTKIIEEYEENNAHGYDNREGNTHVSGVYRWIDKVYKNKVLNYGKRLMYEFMIPEPAMFHNLAQSEYQNIAKEDTLERPIDPRKAERYTLSNSIKNVTTDQLLYWAGVYNAEIEAKPEAMVTVGKSFHIIHSGGGALDHTESNSGSGVIQVPGGYKATRAYGVFNASGDGDDQGVLLSLSIGDLVKTYKGRLIHHTLQYSTRGEYLSFRKPFTTEVPVSYTLGNHVSGDITTSVVCELTPEGEETWKLKAYNTIIDAYEEKLENYLARKGQLESEQKDKVRVNPGLYRELEKTVLRKNCITYLLGHEKVGISGLFNGATTASGIVPNHTSEALETYAARVKFFEQAFEWDIMSYNFYPFYWSDKNNWVTKYNISNDDPLFKAFLQSGMARVIVTVRPGFEEMVNWYLATGQIWSGGQVPTIDDPEFVSIVEELREPESVVEETWESRIPTALTVLQAGTIGLNVEGLPCNTDCGGAGDNPITQVGEEDLNTDDTDTNIVGVGSDIIGDTTIL